MLPQYLLVVMQETTLNIRQNSRFSKEKFNSLPLDSKQTQVKLKVN
jgi:hypothetical protein